MSDIKQMFTAQKVQESKILISIKLTICPMFVTLFSFCKTKKDRRPKKKSKFAKKNRRHFLFLSWPQVPYHHRIQFKLLYGHSYNIHSTHTYTHTHGRGEHRVSYRGPVSLLLWNNYFIITNSTFLFSCNYMPSKSFWYIPTAVQLRQYWKPIQSSSIKHSGIPFFNCWILSWSDILGHSSLCMSK